MYLFLCPMDWEKMWVNEWVYCLVFSCPALSCLVLSCLVLFCVCLYTYTCVALDVWFGVGSWVGVGGCIFSGDCGEWVHVLVWK